VDLVLLPLEPAEEPLDALEVLPAVDHEPPFLVGQLAPRDVESDGRRLRRARESLVDVLVKSSFLEKNLKRKCLLDFDRIFINLLI
jgi:hypothetical protein